MEVHEMKATYQDFLRENPTCAKLAEDDTAQEVFALLSQDENLIAMLDASDRGFPALTPCIGKVQELAERKASPTFDVQNNTVRQMVGCMAKTIIRPFGYRVTKQKNLPKGTGRYFASASCYALLEPENATMRVVKKVEEV